jgi:hypothetical protein
MASKLEKLSDRILFSIIKNVAEKCDSESVSIKTYDEENQGIIESTLKLFGVAEGINYEDNDFIYSLLKLNVDKLYNQKLEGSLDRPQMKTYTFDIDVNETVYQRTTWQHKISSYSDNPYSLVQVIDIDGNLDYWDGREIDRDVYGSEMNDYNIDSSSFTEI